MKSKITMKNKKGKILAIMFCAVMVATASVTENARADPTEWIETQLTVNEFDLLIRYPTWSPDGTKIAYNRFDRRIDPKTYNIYVMAADGSDAPGTLVVHIDHSPNNAIQPGAPAWSPDGQWVAYVHSFHPTIPNGIYKSKADGTGQETLIAAIPTGGAQRTPSWSTDNRIAYGYGGIWVMDANGTDKTQLTTDWGYSPAWSPDGSKIVYVRWVGANREGLWIVDVSSQVTTQLTDISGHEFDPWWSPDGNSIVYAKHPSGDPYNLWMIDVDGTNNIQLTSDDPNQSGWPCWSPDGAKIAFSRANFGFNTGDIWVLTLPSLAVEVAIDIKPGSCPNPINVKSKGVLTVAVLGAEDFDVNAIDPVTILLTREGYEEGVSPIRWSYEDVATPFEGEPCDCHDLYGDGYVDLTLKFDTQELVETLSLDLEEIAGETIPLILTGNLNEEEGGTPINGSDCIKILEKKKKEAINFDLNILFNYATGICIAASDGTTFIYEGMEFRDPYLIYAEEYWGEYQLYLPGNNAFINVEVTYTGSADQVNANIVTEAYEMNTDGSNGLPVKDPTRINFTATQGVTEIIDATFMLPVVPKPLCRFIVKVYHKGKLLMTKEGIFCPPDTAR